MKFMKKWSNLGGMMVKGVNEPGRTTVDITEPVKGNGKVMPWETKTQKGWEEKPSRPAG